MFLFKQVKAADGLPSKLCTNCKTELISFYIFKQKSKRTDQILRSMLPNNTTDPDLDSIASTKVTHKPERPTKPKEDSPSTSSNVNIKLEHEEKAGLLKILEEAADIEEPNYTTDEEDVVYECGFDEPEDEEERTDDPQNEFDENESIRSMVEVPQKSMTQYSIMEYVELEGIEESPVLLDCPDCDELFENGTELEEHIRKAHDQFKCEICFKSFVREVTYIRHTKSCVAPEVIENKEDEDVEEDSDNNDPEELFDDEINSISTECFICNEPFNNNRQYKVHLQKMHKEEVKRNDEVKGAEVDLTCVVCSEGPFKTQYRYDQHVKKHAQMSVINNHMTFHPCHTCRKIFLIPSDLVTHMADVHNTKRKFENII